MVIDCVGIRYMKNLNRLLYRFINIQCGCRYECLEMEYIFDNYVRSYVFRECGDSPIAFHMHGTVLGFRRSILDLCKYHKNTMMSGYIGDYVGTYGYLNIYI